MGIAQHPLFKRYCSIKQSIYNPRSPDYARVGALGITMDWETARDFCHDVEAHLGLPPNGTQSLLTRRDLTKNYTLNNLMWADRITVGNRQKTCHYIAYRGKKRTISQWSRQLGIAEHTVYRRVRQGWSITDIIKRYKDAKK